MQCSVRLSSGQRLSPRKAFERRPFSLRTSEDVGRVRLKAVALVQEVNVTCLFFCFFFFSFFELEIESRRRSELLRDNRDY